MLGKASHNISFTNSFNKFSIEWPLMLDPLFNNFNWKQNNSIIQQFKQHGTNKFTRKEIIFMGHRPSHPRLKWNVLKVPRHLSKIRITSRSTRHIRLFSCNLFIHLLTWLDSLVNVLHPSAASLLLTLTGFGYNMTEYVRVNKVSFGKGGAQRHPY